MASKFAESPTICADNPLSPQHQRRGSFEQKTVLSSWIRSLCQTLRGYGHDPLPLARQAGIDLDLLNIPEARYPLAAVRKFWDLSIQETGDPFIGLRMGDEIQAPALHGLGFALMASSSLEELLKILSRYAQVLSTTMHIEVLRHEEGMTLSIETLGGEEPFHAARIAMLAFVYRQACRLSQHEITPIRVDLSMPEIPGASRLSDYFHIPVTFNAICDAISFRTENTLETYASANPLLLEVNEKVLCEYLARLGRARISDRVLSLIKELLPQGEPRLSAIARRLNLSERTLQRKLEAEKESFLGLLDEARQSLAERWLLHSDLSVVEIGYRLSFSDPSCFCRACYRWFQVSPSEYRNQAWHSHVPLHATEENLLKASLLPKNAAFLPKPLATTH